MAYISKDAFQEYVAQQGVSHIALSNKVDELLQALSGIRGQLAVFETKTGDQAEEETQTKNKNNNKNKNKNKKKKNKCRNEKTRAESD